MWTLNRHYVTTTSIQTQLHLVTHEFHQQFVCMYQMEMALPKCPCFSIINYCVYMNPLYGNVFTYVTLTYDCVSMIVVSRLQLIVSYSK